MGVIGDPTAPNSRNGGAVSRKREQPWLHNPSASSPKCHSYPSGTTSCSADQARDAFDVGIAERGENGQANHLLRDLGRDRQVVGPGGRQATVHREVGDQWVEIAAAVDTVFA